ncbi:MAG TPA: hypothetical protein VE133_19505 [Candidatus Sulfotelmatobacter sp.]|nr:hypothetical protein [Candidatus Sulfotelmatobacter sp.]
MDKYEKNETLKEILSLFKKAKRLYIKVLRRQAAPATAGMSTIIKTIWCFLTQLDICEGEMDVSP